MKAIVLYMKSTFKGEVSRDLKGWNKAGVKARQRNQVENIHLVTWFSPRNSWSFGISSWELVRDVDSETLPQSSESETLGMWPGSLGDSDFHRSASMLTRHTRKAL